MAKKTEIVQVTQNHITYFCLKKDFELKNTRLIKILRTFSKDELKSFRRFVDSPFFNREGKYVLRFFDEIVKGYPEFDSSHCASEQLHEVLYPDNEYNDDTMRKLSSSLQKLAEDFLNFSCYRENDSFREILNLSMLRRRGLSDLFENKFGDLDKKYELKNSCIDLEFFRTKYRIEIEKINYFAESDYYVKDQNNSMQCIQLHIACDSLINLLDIAYNIIVGMNTMYAGKTNLVLKLMDLTDVESFLIMLKKESSDVHQIIELFHLRYLSMLNFDDASFRKYRQSVLKSLNLFTRENKFTMLVALQNFCIRKFVSGERQYVSELHEIHRLMLKEGVLLNETTGYINQDSYRNVILTAVNLRKYDWMKRFINEYENKINPEQRESLTAWAKATRYYAGGEFESALAELHRVKNIHFLSKHDIRILQMKIYYELKDYESGMSLADTYKKMVKNDKVLSEIHRTSNRNFAGFYSRILRNLSNGRIDELDFLRTEIEKTPTNSREWLLEKIGLETGKA